MNCLRVRVAIAAALVFACSAMSVRAEPPRLAMPVDCEPGATCFLQNFIDADPGSGAKDPRCGSATYDGHTGTDIRLLSAAATKSGVPVMAAADGTVKRLRDGVADAFVTGETRESVMSIGCGNAVVLDHGGGLQTIYCHLLGGSLSVKEGDRVARGQRLAHVGFSGLTDFAHLHFEVRRNGRIVDPFTGLGPGEACVAGTEPTAGLWEDGVGEGLEATASAIIQAAFAARAPPREELEMDHKMALPARGASEIYYIARVINVRPGDRVRITLEGPGGFRLETAARPLERMRPRHSEWGTAKTRDGSPLPAGRYVGKAELIRDGRTISERSGELAVGP